MSKREAASESLFLSLITYHLLLSGGYFDHRGTQELVAETVASLHLLHDCVGLYVSPLLGCDRLVYVWVEQVPDGRDDFDPEPFDDDAKLTVYQLDAFKEVFELRGLFGLHRALRFERALKIVHHWKESAHDLAERT